MDVKIERLYYVLRTSDRKYTVFLRERIIAPMIHTEEFEKFDKKEDAERLAEELNGQIKGVGPGD